MTRLRIGCVEYLNTVPLIEGLDKDPRIELVPAVPAALAPMVVKGTALAGEPPVAPGGVDVGLVSVIDAAREGLALLPVGMIGCDGPTLTVRLLSTVPMDRVDRVWVDRESHTSAVLCRVVLERSHGRRPALIEHDALAGEHPETVLLIGDKVVNGSAQADRYEYQLDLGQAWHDLTGLPFVYAMWACRPEMVHTPEVRLARAILDRQRRRNQARLEWIVKARAKAHDWPIDLARQYLHDLIHYEVGDRQRRAVERFFEEAAAIGVIEPARPLWADIQPSVTVVTHTEPCATAG